MESSVLSLGQAIRLLRKAGGFTQRTLAKKLAVDPTYLSHIESDRRDPSTKLLRSLSDELGVPVGVFLAVMLWAELPEQDRDSYRPLIQRLLKLAGRDQVAGEIRDVLANIA